MDLKSSPPGALILRLKTLTSSQIKTSSSSSVVGFVQIYNFLALIQRKPKVFKGSGGSNSLYPIAVKLTEKAVKISSEEAVAREQMEPILARN